MASFIAPLLLLAAAQEAQVDVGPVSETLREARQLDPFYEKHYAVRGFPILGSARVSDAALREAACRIL